MWSQKGWPSEQILYSQAHIVYIVRGSVAVPTPSNFPFGQFPCGRSPLFHSRFVCLPVVFGGRRLSVGQQFRWMDGWMDGVGSVTGGGDFINMLQNAPRNSHSVVCATFVLSFGSTTPSDSASASSCSWWWLQHASLPLLFSPLHVLRALVVGFSLDFQESRVENYWWCE